MQDAYVPLERLVAPFQGSSDTQIAALARNTFIPLDVQNDKQYLLSIRHGHLLEKDVLVALLKGDLHGHAPAATYSRSMLAA
jgi:hypothetical protein